MKATVQVEFEKRFYCPLVKAFAMHAFIFDFWTLERAADFIVRRGYRVRIGEVNATESE